MKISFCSNWAIWQPCVLKAAPTFPSTFWNHKPWPIYTDEVVLLDSRFFKCWLPGHFFGLAIPRYARVIRQVMIIQSASTDVKTHVVLPWRQVQLHWLCGDRLVPDNRHLTEISSILISMHRFTKQNTHQNGSNGTKRVSSPRWNSRRPRTSFLQLLVLCVRNGRCNNTNYP